MNLVKLLKVGRSLNGGKSLFGKYKMAQQTLPRFASTVRPTRSAPALESLLEKAKSASPAAVAQEAAQPAFVTSVLDKTQKIPAGKILRRMDAPVLNRDKMTLAGSIKNKISGLKKKFVPVRSRKKPGAAPVQTEWALEKVTVARNDLTDADIEVVPSKTVPTSRKAHLPDLNQVKTTGSRWIRKTTGLFRQTSPFAAAPEKSSLDDAPENVTKPQLAEKI